MGLERVTLTIEGDFSPGRTTTIVINDALVNLICDLDGNVEYFHCDYTPDTNDRHVPEHSPVDNGLCTICGSPHNDERRHSTSQPRYTSMLRFGPNG